MPRFDPADVTQPPEPSEPLLDFRGIMLVVKDHQWLMVACLTLAVAAAAAYVAWTPPVYEAISTVQVEQEDAKVIKAQQVVSDDMRGWDVLNTIAQKMRNPALLQQVLESNQLMPAEGIHSSHDSRMPTRQELVTKFEHNVKTALRRNTRLIDISVRYTDPRLAARLANSLVETYASQDALARYSTTESAHAFLQKQTEEQKKRLEDSEQALQDYRKKIGSISLLESQDILTPQLQDLSKRLTEAKANLAQAQGAYQDSLKMTTRMDDLLAYAPIATDPNVVETSAEVQRQEDAYALVRLRYRGKHPKYILAAASLEALQKQEATAVLAARARMQEGLRIAWQDALMAQQGLEAQFRTTEADAMQLSDAAVRFHILSREVESDKTQFDALISRLGETALAAQLTPERIRVIQPAVAPRLPVSPKITQTFALAIFAGLAIGLVVSFVLSSNDTSFRSESEVEQFLGLPVVAPIPKLPTNGHAGQGWTPLSNGDAYGAEFFRSLRAHLSVQDRPNEARTILFTSSLPGEGKTFAALRFATSLAQTGLRTLVLDLDLQQSKVEAAFTGQSHKLPGVTDYLLGRAQFAQLCQPHQKVANLSWMPGGPLVENAPELLARANIQGLFQEGLARYDRIVIDTAPLLAASDTLLLAGQAQTVLLVVHGCKTPRLAVQRTLSLLKRADAPVAGIVLNLLPRHRCNGAYHA